MSEGRRAINTVAIAGLVVAVAAGGAAGYVYQRQDGSLGVLEKQIKELQDAQKGATAARRAMDRVRLASSGSLNEGMRGIWTSVRSIQKDLRGMDARIAKIEEKIGGSTAITALKKRLEAVSARSVLLQARVAALEGRKGGRGKTIYVEGGGTKRKGTKSGGGKSKSKASTQPAFWNGCIDSLNKSARLNTSAESVCDCIIGRIQKSGTVSGKDRRRILRQTKFTTRVRGISGGAQKVLEKAVVQCALRHFQKKKKK